MEIEPAPELIEFLLPYSPEIRELFLATRAMIQRETPDATETVWDAMNTVATGPTYTHGHREGFMFVNSYRDHVTLGFTWGVNLDDPEGRLRGSGNQIRHMHINSHVELTDPYILGLVRQAHANAYRPNPPMEAKTIVRVMNGPKRRPT
jgi:hypothetical protein